MVHLGQAKPWPRKLWPNTWNDHSMFSVHLSFRLYPLNWRQSWVMFWRFVSSNFCSPFLNRSLVTACNDMGCSRPHWRSRCALVSMSTRYVHSIYCALRYFWSRGVFMRSVIIHLLQIGIPERSWSWSETLSFLLLFGSSSTIAVSFSWLPIVSKPLTKPSYPGFPLVTTSPIKDRFITWRLLKPWSTQSWMLTPVWPSGANSLSLLGANCGVAVDSLKTDGRARMSLSNLKDKNRNAMFRLPTWRNWLRSLSTVCTAFYIWNPSID